uniref:Chemosensory protein 2 n=1 Tax=Ectropis obliqua TaxID=248899 RepID=A0A1L2BLD4_ECTOB|nr:chemosensory protein 2 [Ectropis obliqua]
MKSFYILFAFFAVCAAQTVAPATSTSEAYYTSDENVDIEALVSNHDAMKQYVDCFTGKVECGPEAGAAKGEFPDALSDACAKCTQVQKHTSKVFFAEFKKSFPADYEAMKKAFDAENKLFPAFDAAIANA